MSRWLLVLMLIGCRGRTELMIGVATDLRAPDALDEAQLVVSRTDQGVPLQVVQWQLSGTPTEPFNLPGSYGIFSDGDEFRITVELQGFKNGSPLVTRTAVMSLVEDQTLFYRMTLVSGCMNKTDCGPNESCIEGACAPRELDSRLFPPFSENLVSELTCASGVNYIDTATNDPMPLSPTASACPGNLCSEGTCLVPPDGDGPSGGDGGIDPGSDAPLPALPPNGFVIASQTIPTSSNQANQLGLDLDGDGAADNQWGLVNATLGGNGLESQAGINTAIATGTSLTLVNVGAGSLATPGPATFATFRGTEPQPAPCNGGGDTICGRHLDGSGSFKVAPDSPLHQPLAGSITGGMMTAGPGQLVLQTFLVGTAQDVELIGARIKLTSVSDQTISGVIAGGITTTDLDTKVIPAMAVQFEAQMNADCPGSTPPTCGCQADSTGETLASFFDSNPQDCTISVAEVRNNSLLQSLLAPDITIGGLDGLSFGVGFTAVRGNFDAPF